MTLLASLLVPAMGLLIALTAGRSHALVWAGVGAYWLAQLISTALTRLYIILLMARPMSTPVWTFLDTPMVDVVGALVPAAAAAAVMIRLLRGTSRRSAEEPSGRRTPIH